MCILAFPLMQKRLLQAIFLLSVVLLIAGCNSSAGDSPQSTQAALQQARTGTEGVTTSLLQDLPPSLLYDENELVALVEVQNKGAFDLNPTACFVQVTGFDRNIIGGNFGAAQSCGTNYGVLEGKNVFNLDGSFNQLEFRAPRVTLPRGVFEYKPTLNFLTCYQYETHTSAEVCIDPQSYQITSEQKACQPVDISMGGGQGGPVGVSSIGVEMTGSKAIFEITIRNFKPSARILSPNAYIRDCGQGIFDFTDFDRVGYDVRISSGGRLRCTPTDAEVRLNNGVGKIICTYDISGPVAFETPLLIDLQYGVMDQFSKQITIIETPN